MFRGCLVLLLKRIVDINFETCIIRKLGLVWLFRLTKCYDIGVGCSLLFLFFTCGTMSIVKMKLIQCIILGLCYGLCCISFIKDKVKVNQREVGKPCDTCPLFFYIILWGKGK